ncbi:MAG: tetratricopeptide repeat protein [Opitutae bacterium]|nr:tetratricopeptide repeat protein [Opitutae bacterium]MBT7923469.1 tetratricopeptide repeat protein [Opitutae bacterium]
MTALSKKILLSVICLIVFSHLSSRLQAVEEVRYPAESFAKLDTFEALNLEDADKLFLKKDYKGAYAAYKAYSLEFARSPALGYVLLRMGRCLHLLDKRNHAIRSYREVVDYFPDDVPYAAAALYFMGKCHEQNGEDAKQVAVWAELVKDDEYVLQPNSGSALTFLGKAMEKLEKFDDAAEYHWRTAVAFAKSNERAAQSARASVFHHYVRRKPNHDKLKEFFIATNAFGDRQGKGANPQEDPRYWKTALDYALGAKENPEDVSRYWTSKMGDSFAEHDELRIKLFNLQRVYENDKVAWGAKMDKQFGLTPPTLRRVYDWIGHYNWDQELELAFAMKHGGPLVAGAKPNERTLVIERMRWNRNKFYEKWILPTARALKREEKIWLMNRLRHPCGLHAEAQSVIRMVNVSGMTDEELKDMGTFAAYYLTENEVLAYFAKIANKSFAGKARFDYFIGKSHQNRPFKEKALAEVPSLKKIPDYAGPELSWKEGTLLQELGRYAEAIKSYRAANKQPHSTWAIADCLVGLKQFGKAVELLRELENSVGAFAPVACLKICNVYRTSGDKGKEIGQLRLVLRRHPKSKESSEAHQRLETYGVRLTGGEGEAEE